MARRPGYVRPCHSSVPERPSPASFPCAYRQPPLHDNVAERLREQIFAGEFAPGAFLDETALCERLAISRTPLREALKVLTAEGLLRHEPRRGAASWPR